MLGPVKHKGYAWTQSIFAGKNKRPSLQETARLGQLSYRPTFDII